MNTTTLHMFGASGGVGTTTTAVGVALALAGTHTVSIYSDDAGAVSGAPASNGPVMIAPGVTVLSRAAWADEALRVPAEIVIIDNERGAWDIPFAGPVVRIGCVANSYLSLRHATGQRADLWVLLTDKSAALGVEDCEAILSGPVVAVDRDQSVNRAIDAGLLVGGKCVAWARRMRWIADHATANRAQV